MAFAVGGAVAGLITQGSIEGEFPFQTVQSWITNGPAATIAFWSVAIAMVSAIIASWTNNPKVDLASKLIAVVAAALAFWGVAINFWTQFAWWGFLATCVVILLVSILLIAGGTGVRQQGKKKLALVLKIVGLLLIPLALTWPILFPFFGSVFTY
ncbi:hypothetical protein [uncultured Microbacterium sp.]|uniref:hypothetical protein n=1 Tax=uncultured Microbacterium sp. TaxID=191216 RepID=UPI0026282AC0|nr:hypothetical protein [uncultured Microbacterium sp.]